MYSSSKDDDIDSNPPSDSTIEGTTTKTNGSNDETSDAAASPTQQPPYPHWTYPFQRDEDSIQYNFISFIDHFDGPYSQVARLIEPRLYARADPFTNNKSLPTIDDVACPPSQYGPLATFLALL